MIGQPSAAAWAVDGFFDIRDVWEVDARCGMLDPGWERLAGKRLEIEGCRVWWAFIGPQKTKKSDGWIDWSVECKLDPR